MSWAKLDDGFHCHAKVIGTDLAAIGLYALGLSYVAQQRTDGLLQPHVARHLARGDLKVIAQLVASKLWIEHPDGYEVHDYLRYNPSAKQLKKQAKLSAARQRDYRERHGVTRPLVTHSPQRDGTGYSVLSPSQSFEQFWKAYPRKKSKGAAERVWAKLKPDATLLARILAAIETNAPRWRADLQYAPYPATWLHAKGWEDEPEVNGADPQQRLAVADLNARIVAAGRI